MVRHLKPMRSMQDLLLGSIRFLHYINDRSKTILKSLVNIYAHDTTVYGYLDGPSMFSGLWSDQALAVQWEKKKLAYKFSSSPCWLWILTSYDDWLHYQRSSFLWETIESQVHSRHQVELMHTINRQRRWKKLIGFLYRFRRYLIPPAMLYIYKSHIRPTNGLLLPYLCWSCFIFSFQTWQRSEAVKWPCRWCIIFHPMTFPHRCNVASLSLRDHYFHGKCSEELRFPVQPIQTFTSTMYTGAKLS